MTPIISSTFGVWVALDSENNVLSEGLTPEEVIKNLENSVQTYALMFIGEKDVMQIY
jgi:hypothetical protein